jgi:ribonuclease P protein component
VLFVIPAEGETTRIGITAGHTVGKAVQRNRSKRLLREAIRPLLPKIKPGWKLLLITRSPILNTNFTEIQACLCQLFSRADLIVESNG